MFKVIGGLLIIISIAFLIATLVGLVYPKLFSRKRETSPRLRVLKRQGLYTIGTFFTGLVIVIATSEKRPDETTQTEKIAPVRAEAVSKEIEVVEKPSAEQRLDKFREEYKRFDSRVDTGKARDIMYRYSERSVVERVKSEVLRKYEDIGIRIAIPENYDTGFMTGRKHPTIRLNENKEIVISHNLDWSFDYPVDLNDKQRGHHKFYFKVATDYNVDTEGFVVKNLEIIDPEEYYKDYRYSHKMPFVKSIELLREYMANEVRADREYKGKRIRVNGIVQGILKDPQGNPVVGLGNKKDIIAVRVNFKKSDSYKVSKLEIGDDLVVECEVEGVDRHNNIHLNKSRIVSASRQ